MQQRRRITAARHKPTLAIVLTAALVASTAIVGGGQILKTQDSGIGPVDARNESSSFADGANVTIDDPAIGTQGDGSGERTVKEFERDEPFSMFALTWDGNQDVAAYVRAEQQDGSWSEWYDMEPLDIDEGVNGTELVFHGSTNRVQVSTHNIDLFTAEADGVATAGQVSEEVESAAPDQAPAEDAAPVEQAQVEEAPAAPAPAAVEPSAPAEEPAEANNSPAGFAPLPTNYGDIQPVADAVEATDLNAVFIDGVAEAGVGDPIALANDSVGMPRVVSRAGWGANENLRCRQPTIDDQVSAITIHHTAGSNNYSPQEAAGIVRGVYSYHASTLGWCDVGYQALVDKYGTIYEGRYGGLNQAVQGAHAGGFNQNTWGISMMGDYSNVTPSSETINAVGELAGWRAKVAGFDPTGSDVHVSEGTSYSRYAYGTRVTLPNIFAHRDVGTTTCPGNAGYAQMDTIRNIAKRKYDALNNGSDTSTTTTPSNPAPPTTTTPNPPSEPTPSDDSTALRDLINATSSEGGINGLLNGADSGQIISAVGSIAAIAIGMAAAGGHLPSDLGNLGGIPIVENLTLADVVPVVDAVISFTGDNKYSQAWRDVNELLGPVLGDARGGVTTVQYTSELNSEVSYVPFDNGIIVSSPEAGTNALWGAIGDAWAKQGLDLGPLGLPVNHEYADGDLLRVDFQNGHITFNPATGETNMQVTE